MATNKTKALGKGLSALLSTDVVPQTSNQQVLEININEIKAQEDQPRKFFNQSALEELANSIRENGIIQPIIVTKVKDGYAIVAGERRWRASKIAGKKHIPAIVKELSDQEILLQALIENVQREDLNVMEEALALQKLQESYDLTQENLAKMVGKSRPAVANTIRLLNLADYVQDLLKSDEISAGHARALLAMPNEEQQKQVAIEIVKKDLSVRKTEQLIKQLLRPKKVKVVKENNKENIRSLEERFQDLLGTKVIIKDNNNKGTIAIEYYSLDDMERILQLISKD